VSCEAFLVCGPKEKTKDNHKGHEGKEQRPIFPRPNIQQGGINVASKRWLLKNSGSSFP
jgi:hypothetical protein